MADTFRTLIVSAAHVDLARSIAASFGTGGEGMWLTPLSSDGAEPASHYVSSGYIPEQFAYMVPCQTWTWQQPDPETPGAWTLTDTVPGDPVAVFNAAQAAGIDCTQADIDSLFSSADVTEQEPFVAFDRLGLRIVQPVVELT